MQAIKNKETKALTKEEFGLSDEEFKVLWKVLNQKDLLDFDLLDTLGIKSKVNSLHYKDTIQAILFLYEQVQSEDKKKFDDTDIPFSGDLKKDMEGLWSQLKDQKIVKDPAVRFSLNRDPEKTFDRIKDYVGDHLHELIADTSLLKFKEHILPNGQKVKEIVDRDKLIDSISKSLELAIGKIKFLPELKLSEKTIQDYYKEGKMPPEIVEYTRRCCDGVLSLVKDASWFSWDAFACAMIGIAQIVAGAILCGIGMGFIGQILIREGISDIVFAVQSSLAGNFSWKAYGEHKLVSLAISVATAGFGALVSGAEIGGKAIAEGSKTAYVLGKLAESAFEATISIGVNLLSSQLVDLASKSIFEGLLNSFSKSVDDSKEIIEKKQVLQNKFEELCKKFGVDEANDIIRTRLAELNLKQKIEGRFSTQVMKYTQMAAQELSKRKDTLGTIAKIADALIKWHGGLVIVAEMTTNTKDILEELEHNLQKYDGVPPKDDRLPVDDRRAKEFAKAKQQETSKAIISQIQASIQSMVLQPAAQLGLRFAVNAATEGVRKELFKEVHGLEERARREHIMDKAGRGELILSPEERAENLAALKKLPGGKLLNAEQVKALDGQIVIDGTTLSIKDAAKLYGGHAHFVQHDKTFYIIKPDYRQILVDIKNGMYAGIFELRVLASAVNAKIVVLDGKTMKPHELAPNGVPPFGDAAARELTIVLENGHYIPCEKDANGIWQRVSLNTEGVQENACAAQAIVYAAERSQGQPSDRAKFLAENRGQVDAFLTKAVGMAEQSGEAKQFYYSGEQDKTPGLLGGNEERSFGMQRAFDCTSMILNGLAFTRLSAGAGATSGLSLLATTGLLTQTAYDTAAGAYGCFFGKHVDGIGQTALNTFGTCFPTSAGEIEFISNVAPLLYPPAQMNFLYSSLATTASILSSTATQVLRPILFRHSPASTQVAQTTPTLVGSSRSQMRSAAEKMISSNPNHPLRFTVNDSGRFHQTRHLTHAEMMDNPALIRMGHVTSRSSGAPERVALQGAWQNQFDGLTIEHRSIGGFVENRIVDIGGVAVEYRTAMEWQRYGFIKPDDIQPVIERPFTRVIP